jgi:hypothetical protein
MLPKTSQLGRGTLGSLILGYGPDPAAATNVRITQEALEVVVDPGTANVRVTQDVLEVVVDPGTANVRVTQVVLEVVRESGGPASPDAWTVNAIPRIRWTGATLPLPNAWTVNGVPHIEWEPFVTDPGVHFTVEPTPVVKWVTGPGVADSDCISGDGVIPPVETEGPVDSGDQNYVF